MLAIFTVNTTVDEDDGISDNQISLRDAVNVAAAGDRIEFDSSLNGATIVLDRDILGQIDIERSLTIDGSTRGITIKGEDNTEGFHNNGDGTRLFNISDATSGESPPVVEMIGLKLTFADPAPGGGTPEGGAIRSAGILTLRNMVIRENGAGHGAGVFVEVAGASSTERTVLHIVDSQIEHNSAYVHGGAVFVKFDATSGGRDTVRIEGSSLSHNLAGPVNESGGGGAMYITGAYASSTNHAVIISSTTLDSNDADWGGAISYNPSSRVDLSIVQNSSISGNLARTHSGGGVYAVATLGSQLRIADSIVSDNEIITNGNSGGGLFVKLLESSSLVVERSTVSGNSAKKDGGGIYVRADEDFGNWLPTPRAVTISESTISGNTTPGRGGGIYASHQTGTETMVQESRISGNHAGGAGTDGAGGGIYVYLRGRYDLLHAPKFTISGSTVDNNDGGNRGGGIFVCSKPSGEFIGVNSTLSANRTNDELSGEGGGIYIAHFEDATNSIDAYLRNMTVTQNVSASGGGVATKDFVNTRVRIANSIVSQNFNHQSAANNLDGRVVVADFKHNLIGTGSTILDHDTGQVVYRDQPPVNSIPAGNNNIMGVAADSPQLGPLQNNGGPTPTHRPLGNSPVIDAGSNALAKIPLTGDPGNPNDDTPLTTDQRGTGFPRIFDYPGVTVSGAGPVGAHETELCVSTPNDEFDTQLNLADLSLREALNYANTAGVLTVICVPAGTYNLSLTAMESVDYGDLDVTGNVTIVGDGPGLSIIRGGSNFRVFDVANLGVLNISRVTLEVGHGTHNSDHRNGAGIRVQNGGQLHMDNSAVVGNETGTWGLGGGIFFGSTAIGSIESSVITVNHADQQTGGLYLQDAAPGMGGTVTIESTIVANNTDTEETDFPDIYVGTYRTLTSLGNNRFTSVPGGLGVFNSGSGDYVGQVDYVVTSIADTYDGSSDPVNMSLRDAIRQANITAGAQEIWLPAWEFRLTREGTEGAPDVAIGDLDLTEDVTIRGIDLATTIDATAIVDAAFEQIGGVTLTLDKVTVIN